MCRRADKQAREAQDAAADALVLATIIHTDGPKTLRDIYDETIRQPIPEYFTELLGRLS